VRISQAFSIAAIVFASSMACSAQPSGITPPAQGAPAQTAAPAANGQGQTGQAQSGPAGASALMKPALDSVQQTVGALKLDKWKKGTVRDEAGTHLSAIQRDLQTTLPPLLQAADSAPESTSKVLAVSRNVGALYDVLLSVTEAARVSAPPDQVTQLEQTLSGLGNARRSLDDRLQDSAASLEKQVILLRTTLQTQAAAKPPAPPAPVLPACPAPAAAHKAKKKPKPPATTPPSTTAPATPKPGS